MSRSTDGGITWSEWVRVSSAIPPAPGSPPLQAFTPAVRAAGGIVAVSYYDTRDDFGEPDRLRVAHWLATSTDGATFTDARMSEPFNLRAAAIGERYFLGDYMGLAASAGRFLPFFVVSGIEDRSDVVFRPADSMP